jgi:hypothetical protein
MNDIARKRWDSGDGMPGSYSIEDCLEALLHRVRSGDLDAEHIIVAYGKIEDGAALTGYVQAGSFDAFAQAGLLRFVGRMFDE